MGVYKKEKSWYIDYYVKSRRKRGKIGPSKKLAQQVLRDVRLKIAKGEYLGIYDEEKILFEDFSRQYLAYSKANKAWLTYQRRDQISIGHLRSIVIAALNTGMRRGEILALRWADVDLGNRKITVKNTKNNETKVIPINQTLYEELLNLSKESDGEYVFSNGEGQRFGDIKTGFLSALRRAGIEDFRFHDLRHTFGSQLVMQGIDLKTVQQMTGYKQIKMTMRYSYLSPEYVQEVG